jgi:hypothetical protein
MRLSAESDLLSSPQIQFVAFVTQKTQQQHVCTHLTKHTKKSSMQVVYKERCIPKKQGLVISVEARKHARSIQAIAGIATSRPPPNAKLLLQTPQQ